MPYRVPGSIDPIDAPRTFKEKPFVMPTSAKLGCLYILLLPALVLWRAFATRVLWGWFAVPLGAPHLGLATVYGLTLLVGMFQSWSAQETDELTEGQKATRVKNMLYYAIAIPAVSLLFGYITLKLS